MEIYQRLGGGVTPGGDIALWALVQKAGLSNRGRLTGCDGCTPSTR